VEHVFNPHAWLLSELVMLSHVSLME